MLFGPFIWIWSFIMLETRIQHQLLFFVTLYSNFICGWSLPLQSLSEHQTQGPSVDPKCCMPSGLGSSAISISWPLPSVVFVFVFSSLSSAEHWCLSVSLLSGLKRHTRWLMGKTNHASSRGKESTTRSFDWALKDLGHTWHILNTHTYIRKGPTRSQLSCTNYVTFQEMTDSSR